MTAYLRNVVVIADEAYRTQYGFKARTVDEKDKAGNVTGKRIVYGFAKYLRDALPNATYMQKEHTLRLIKRKPMRINSPAPLTQQKKEKNSIP